MDNGSAAVAIVTDGSSFVLIRRALFQGDPWSGNFALPGGHIKAGETPEEAVLREITEEIGLTFRSSDIAGSLETAHPVSRPWMDVYPFIIRAAGFQGIVNGKEVSESRIVRFDSGKVAVNSENGKPSLDFDGWIVWGLTYRILRSYARSKGPY